MLKILRYLRPYKISAALGLFFKFVETAAEVLLPVIMADLITQGVQTREMAIILPKGLLMLGIIAANIVVAVLGQYFAARAATQFGRDVRRDVFKKINTLSFEGLNAFGSSSLVNRLMSDTAQVQNTVFMFVRVGARAPFLALGSFVMALLLDVSVSIVFLVTMPLIGGALMYVLLKAAPMYDKLANMLDGVTSAVNENYSGSRVIRSFSTEKRERQRFFGVTSEYRHYAVRAGKLSAMLSPIATFIMQIGIVIIIVLGGEKVFLGQMPPAQITAFITYMLQILLAMMVLTNLIMLFIKGAASAGRINQVLTSPLVEKPYQSNEQTENAELQKNQSQKKQDLAQSFDRQTETLCDGQSLQHDNINPQTNDGTMPPAGYGKTQTNNLQTHQSAHYSVNDASSTEHMDMCAKEPSNIPHIVFDRVSFAYAGGQNVVSGISVSLDRGETLGIIGGTGSGKTTLINLIPGFYFATEGSVLVDGKDVKDYDLALLRASVGIVPQATALFKGSIRENIALGDKHIPDEDIIEALGIAQAHFALRYREKLDKQIEQGGRNLSGGQRQRLAIARAVAKKPEILILDDSSSALDYRTDAALFNALSGKLCTVTKVIISQRVFSIMRAHKILVLRRGKAVGLGTHAELLQSCSIYRDIYNTQSKA